MKQAFNYMERVGSIPRTPLKAIKMTKPESDAHSDSHVLDLYYHMFDEDLEKSIEAIRIQSATGDRAA